MEIALRGVFAWETWLCAYLLERNRLPPCQNVTHALHLVEVYRSARLALQMVEQARQRCELLRTGATRTMIQSLSMRGAAHVLVE